MNSNPQTVPFARSLPRTVEGIALNLAELPGKSLPCSVVSVNNAMVKVKFEVQGITLPQITVPQAISRYARPPTQVGDKGFVVAADVYLGGVSGLGGGTANFTRQEGNLATLVFVPISQTSFPSINPNAYHITGPGGAIIQDDSGASVITVTPSSIVLTQGSASITLSGGTVAIVGTLTINGHAFASHQHSGVTAGGSNTGGVV
jgi:hypothetical protein